VLENNAEQYPENFFGHGFVYNQQVFFDLSVQFTGGISRQPFVDPDPLGPGNTTNPWFHTGVYLTYWAMNDIVGLMSGQRKSLRMQSNLVSSPYNFYLFGGGDIQFIANNIDPGLSDRVLNMSVGAGFQSYLAFAREFRGFVPFVEMLYTRNMTPYYQRNDVTDFFQYIAFRIGVRYSYRHSWENRFNK